jgi:hypothetical protein
MRVALVLIPLWLGWSFGAANAAPVTDDLQCYKITNQSLKAIKAVVDLDAPSIGTAPGCTLTKPKLYCVPAATSVRPGTLLDGKQPLTPLPFGSTPADTARVCYGVTCKKPSGRGPDSTVTDRFGTHAFGKLATQIVCAPAVSGSEPRPVLEITSPDVEIDPGQENTYCYYFRTPNLQTVAVKKWKSTMAAVIHDATVFTTSADIKSPGSLIPGCTGLQNASAQNVPSWLYAADTASAELPFPADDGTGKPVALELPANKPGYVILHYLNTTDTKVSGHFTLIAETLGDAVSYTRTNTYIAYDGSISISPAIEGYVESQNCAVPAGAQFWHLSTHAHKQATRTRVLDGASILFESFDWEHPGAETRSGSPFLGFASNVLTTQCTYDNYSNRTITAGDDPQTDEQCVGVGYFFPATAPKVCYNGFAF